MDNNIPQLKGADLVSPLTRLIERGDKVELLNGRLSITPKSGLPIPDQWLKEHEQNLVLDMANLTDQLYLTYTGFDCGYYGKHKAGGLNLHLTNMANHKPCYTIFNIGLKRTRSSKTGMAGTRLPKGQFTVTQKQGFYLFWLATGLKVPDRVNSRLWGYMGNLAPLHFTGSYDPSDTKQEKILTKSIKPLQISHEDLIKTGLPIHKPCTSHTLAAHNAYTAPIHKKTAPRQWQQGIQAKETTGKPSYDKRLKGNEVNSAPYSPPIQAINPLMKRPQDQTINEWLADYQAEEIKPSFHLIHI